MINLESYNSTHLYILKDLRSLQQKKVLETRRVPVRTQVTEKSQEAVVGHLPA